LKAGTGKKGEILSEKINKNKKGLGV
jgi:hypothetical protein